MPRLLAYILCLLIASGLVLGSAANAYDRVICSENCSTVSTDQGVGTADENPAKPSKCQPCRCCGCHSPSVGVPVLFGSIQGNVERMPETFSWEQAQGAGLIGVPAHRPPKA